MCASAAKQLTATSDWFFIPWNQGRPLTATSDKFSPPQAIQKKKPRSYRHKRLGLEMLHLPHLKQQSPAAVKKKLAPVKNERSYCHKQLGHLTATSEARALQLCCAHAFLVPASHGQSLQWTLSEWQRGQTK